MRDTRGVDLLSFNLSLNGQQIISLEQVEQWRGGACAELGKKTLKMSFFNVLLYFLEKEPPRCDWIKVNIKQSVKRLCTKTLVCLEMRLLCTLSSLKEVLDLSWSLPGPGELPAQCCGHALPW